MMSKSGNEVHSWNPDQVVTSRNVLQVIAEPWLISSLDSAARFLMTVLFQPSLLGLDQVDYAALSRFSSLAQVGLIAVIVNPALLLPMMKVSHLMSGCA